MFVPHHPFPNPAHIPLFFRQMTYAQMSSNLAGPIGLLKQYVIAPHTFLQMFSILYYVDISPRTAGKQLRMPLRSLAEGHLPLLEWAS